ncbi:MAG: host attachment protein [Marivita sp.]|uniref:host attachment family protein n=1 Tax=Marivita sp. TaxID=2003365 RepID=UPI001B0D3408|nr:host attachment family protein [Marivita sp.]MBO6885556.1 host attachment protein [Marivita sp.]
MTRKSGVPHDAWVLIADGEKALYLVNKGDEMDMNLVVRDKDEQDNPKAQDWAANRPGRFNDGPSVHRSAVADTDWHQLEKERFAKDIAEQLYKDVQKGRFKDLIIVASRPALAELRKELHQEVADCIRLDVAKVLTNHPIDEIETLVSREMENT